ncbi:MAG: hypothetical protein JSV34_03365 [Candidatus Omnitrophota bacterium]|nr:MAG: hypothetical protein JSV34_03365 [Candidatus Omnitrophota bacterium]
MKYIVFFIFIFALSLSVFAQESLEISTVLTMGKVDIEDDAYLATGTGKNVGIGTSNTNERLTVDGVISLKEINTTGGVGVSANHGKIYVDDKNSKLYFWNDDSKLYRLTGPNALDAADGSPADAVYVDNDGNVGIGTTSPISLLNLPKDTNRTELLIGEDIRLGAVYTLVDLAIGNTNNDCVMYMGQSTFNKGFVSWKYNETASEGSFQIGTVQGNNPLALQPSAGNVGIGTTGPDETLEVNGNVKLSGATATHRITNVAEPTDNNDVATKGYVDAASGVTFVGVTSASYDGDMGGIKGMCDKCHSDYPDSHPCTYDDIIKIGRLLGGVLWVIDGMIPVYAGDSYGLRCMTKDLRVTCTNVPSNCSCGGWTKNEELREGPTFQNGRMDMQKCDTALKIPCCK